jgi:hypothetical protein
MRTVSKTDVRDVPRWALWLVAVVCFGPLTLMWLLGVLFVPLWVLMTSGQPERFAHDPSVTIWEIAWPIGFVIGGFIGLVGLVCVLTVSRRTRPKTHRVFRIGMVAVGLMTLLIFHQPLFEGGFSDFSYFISVTGLTHAVLPFTGAAWLLWKSRRFLLASPQEA